MQQNQPRFSPLRRLFFPFTGEEPLTRAQQVRVIALWAIVLPIVILICSLPVVAIYHNGASFQKIVLLLLLIFLGGVIIFALTAWFVVWAVNRSARLVQQQRRAAQSATMNE